MTTRIAVCGAGAFGRNHIRIYRELAGVHVAAIVDPDRTRAEGALAEPNALQARVAPDEAGEGPELSRGPLSLHPPRIFPSTEELLAAIAAGQLQIDAASVCTPTSTHHAVASQLLEAGVHVLLEKPIAATLDEADDLLALAARHNRVLTVGHLERFNPVVQALAPLLRGPMFFEAHRLSVFSPRSLDTDVVLDLMIHDLDIVLCLARSPVTQVHAVGLPILSAKTDIANVRVEFASGCVANFTASRVSTERVRKLRFFQPHQYLSVDYARQDLLVIEVKPPASTAGGASADAGFAGAPAVPLPTLGMHKPQVIPGEPLRLEIEAFLHAVSTGKPPEVTAVQARDALALALQIQQAIEQHARHTGLQAFSASWAG